VIEEEPVVDSVESRRHQVEAGQDSDLLVIGRREAPSRTFSRPSAVSVRPLLYADWNWLKLAELSRCGAVGVPMHESLVTGWRVWQWLAQTREHTTSVTSTAEYRVVD